MKRSGLRWKVLFVENTTRCNLRCPGCKRPRTNNQDMSMEVYKATLSIFQSEPIENIAFFWRGEPTLDARLPLMIKMAKTEDTKPIPQRIRQLRFYTTENTFVNFWHPWIESVSVLMDTIKKH